MKIQSAIAIITSLVSAVEAGKNTTQAPTPTVTRPVEESTPPITPFPTQEVSSVPPVSSPPETSVPETSPPVSCFLLILSRCVVELSSMMCIALRVLSSWTMLVWYASSIEVGAAGASGLPRADDDNDGVVSCHWWSIDAIGNENCWRRIIYLSSIDQNNDHGTLSSAEERECESGTREQRVARVDSLLAVGVGVRSCLMLSFAMTIRLSTCNSHALYMISFISHSFSLHAIHRSTGITNNHRNLSSLSMQVSTPGTEPPAPTPAMSMPDLDYFASGKSGKGSKGGAKSGTLFEWIDYIFVLSLESFYHSHTINFCMFFKQCNHW